LRVTKPAVKGKSMSLWETSCCIQSLSIELHEHIGDSSPQFLPELLSILKSISGRGDEAIRMQNLALGHYRATMCVKLASAFVSALRVAHKCARFDVDMQRHWNRSPMTRTTAWGRQFALYLSTLTVEGILRAYTAIPPGHIHTACEHEISWYFKLVEDRITYGELDNAVSKKDVCIPVLQSNLERAVTVGVHFSLAALCVGTLFLTYVDQRPGNCYRCIAHHSSDLGCLRNTLRSLASV